MESIIKIENLIFEYIRDDYSHQENQENPVTICERAIDGVSLDIERGSFTAIIGKNGSGKSTLAKNINGLLVPTEGTVVVNGWDTRNEDHIWDVRQSAGMVFQNPDNQLVSAIVEDDVAFGPENIGVEPAEIRRRVKEALEAVDMLKYKDKGPHLLSGGQKQRIAIAGVVAMRPDCIVFDEPTAMLDPKGRREIMQIIKQLNEEDISVVLITHFMEEAAQANRVIIMDNGKVLLDGTPQQVFSERETIKTANLDVPLPVELGYRLRKRGIDVPTNIIDAEEMVEYLCQLK